MRPVRARLDVFGERIRGQLEVLREHVSKIVRGLRCRLTSYGYIKVEETALGAKNNYLLDRIKRGTHLALSQN